MKTDGQFGVHVAQIQAKYNQPVNLFCIGDVHRNAPNCSVDKWHEDLKEMKKVAKSEPTFFLFTGDLLEYLSSSERRFFTSGGFHESTMTRFDEMCANDVDMFCRETEFMTGSVVGCYGGNHFFRFSDGTTSDNAICAKLGATYIGCSGYTILSLNTDNNHSHVVRVFAHHGTGSGKRVGSSFNGLEDASSYFCDADIILMGHNHQLGVTPISSLKCDRGQGDKYRIKAVDRWLGRTGSYLQSYGQRPSYAVDAMMRPSKMGSLRFILTPRRKQFGNAKRREDRWIEIKAVV
jgi:hypothetical protein